MLHVKTFEIKILLWLFVSIVITLSALGVVGTGPAAPLPAERSDELFQAVHWPSAVETPPPPSLTIPSALPGGPPTRPEHAPPPAEPAPSGRKCPLSRVAMVRGSDSE